MLLLQPSVHASCDRMEWCRLRTLRRLFIPLGEWFRIFPRAVYYYPVSYVYILQHLSCLCTWGVGGVRHPLLGIGRWQMIIFTRVYLLLETLGPLPQQGRYHHLQRRINDLTSPMGKEPITDMSHLVVISSYALLLNESVTRSLEGV